MQTEDFLAHVQQRAGLAEREDAVHLAESVLTRMGQLNLRGESAYLAAQLPGPMSDLLTRPNEQEELSTEEFLETLQDQLQGLSTSAEEATTAVLSATFDRISERERMDILTQLPEGFGRLAPNSQ